MYLLTTLIIVNLILLCYKCSQYLIDQMREYYLEYNGYEPTDDYNLDYLPRKTNDTFI